MKVLKSKIYEVASKMKYSNQGVDEHLMGRMVPESYMKLATKIEEIRKKSKENEMPILSRQEFLEVAKSFNCTQDEFSESDIDTAALFLHITGLTTHLFFNLHITGLTTHLFFNLYITGLTTPPFFNLNVHILV